MYCKGGRGVRVTWLIPQLFPAWIFSFETEARKKKILLCIARLFQLHCSAEMKAFPLCWRSSRVIAGVVYIDLRAGLGLTLQKEVDLAQSLQVGSWLGLCLVERHSFCSEGECTA